MTTAGTNEEEPAGGGDDPSNVAGFDAGGAPSRRTTAHAVAIARVEVVRSVRSLFDQTNKLVGIAITGLLLVAFTLAGVVGLLALGGQVLDAAADNVAAVRGAIAGFWLFVAGMTTFRTVSVVGAIDGAPGMLTATSPRAVAGGLVLGEATRHALHLTVPGLLVAGALSVGTGSVLAGPALLFVGAFAWASAFATGYLAGQSVRYLSRAVPFVRRNRLRLVAVGMVGYMVVVVQFASLAAALGATPVGWYADFGLLLVAGVGSEFRAAAAVALTLGGGPLFLAAAYRVAQSNWYGDPSVEESGDPKAGTSALRGAGDALERVVSRPAAAIARAAWLRARRSPFKLAFAIVPAFAFVGYLAPQLQAGTLPESMPVMLAGYAAWGVGAAFTLNPLGDEGALLPVTVTAGISGRAFVGGRLLAAWLPGVGPTATVVALAAVVVGKPPVVVLLVAVYGGVLALVAPAIAAGVGMAIPNFETRTVMLSREAVVPSSVAFFGFLLLLGVVGLPGAVGLVFFEGPGSAPVSIVSVRAAGVATTGVLGLLLGGAGVVYAVRSFGGYDLDR